MSEELLKALMQLFGITVRLEGVSQKERNIVQAFLSQQLNPQDVPTYLHIFEQYAHLKTSQVYEAGEKLTPVKVSSKMLRISAQINKELTQQQEIVVVVRILELIVADEKISKHEQDFVETIATVFNISREEFEAIQTFVTLLPTSDFSHDYVLHFSSQASATAGQRHLQVDNLRGILAFLRIPSLEMYMVKYLGSRDYYLNGVILKPNQIAPFPTGSSIRGNRLATIYYSDVVSEFRIDQIEENVSFEAKNVSYTFPNTRIGLHQINIAEGTGKLLGIMGASGSGKSTLLEILNGNLSPQQGKVLVNGIDIHKEKLEGLVGYVPQDDMLIEELTVYENIYYAAQLCFGIYSTTQIEQLVEKTLTTLGLYEIRDLRVGSTLNKVISGGQRKRLNIGLELLRAPSILFVDEPTSGLSSRDSENIMDLLKELTLSGKLVFVVIHQPSSNIFKMFDKLYILDSGGYPIYYGNPVEAIRYFKQATNQINSDATECHECGNVIAEVILDLIETIVVIEYGRFTEKRKMSPQQWYQRFEANIALPTIDHVGEKTTGSLQIPHRLKQVGIFFRRDFFSKLRNRSYLIVTLLQAPVLAFLLAYVARYYNVYSEAAYQYRQNENIPVYIFIAVIVTIFMGLVVSVEEINKDRKILKREAFLHLSRNSYLIAKVAILFSIAALQVLLLVSVGNAVLGIEGMFLDYFCILFSCACFANLLGLNVSSAFDSTITTYVLVPLLLIPQLMLGGIVIQFDKMNPHLKYGANKAVPLLSEMMASRWAFEALAVRQFTHNDYYEPVYEWDKQIAQAEYKKIYLIPQLTDLMDFLEGKEQFYQDQATYSQQQIRIIVEKTLQREALQTRLTLTTTRASLSQLQAYYQRQQQQALEAKNTYWADLVQQKGKEWVNAQRDQYYNEALAYLVKNKDTENRVYLTAEGISTDLYPIYLEQDTIENHFFASQKKIGSRYWSTFGVNLWVVWLMTALLYVTLYLDIFRRVLAYLNQLVQKQDFSRLE
ncbi:MAG: ATP-binding cassette domain-containing protein [Thermonemataceae bacterium]